MAFRDLNHGLGCFPRGEQVYPAPPSPHFYDVSAFGVGQETEPFRALNPQSVSLPLILSPCRLDYGQFRSEPAITGFDGLITPNPKLEKRLHTELLRASTPFYRGFTLPWIRSPGFGSYPCDYMPL